MEISKNCIRLAPSPLTKQFCNRKTSPGPGPEQTISLKDNESGRMRRDAVRDTCSSTGKCQVFLFISLDRGPCHGLIASKGIGSVFGVMSPKESIYETLNVVFE